MRNMKKFIICLITVLAAAMMGLTGCGGGTKIDVTEGVEVSFSGANGYGKAAISGTSEWEDEAYAVIYEKYSGNYEKLLQYEILLYDADVSFELSQTEGLSNGDTVTVNVTIDDSNISDLPVKLTGKSFEVTVEGLPEVQTIDLFEDVEITYSGYSPYAEVYIDGSCDYTDVSYYCNEDYVSNGDTVTIYAEYDEDELLEAGYLAEADSMEIEVTDLNSYITELSQIPDETLEKMKAQAEDVMAAKVANSWDEEGASFEGMEYLGCYLLTPKSSSLDWGTDANRVILVYEVSVWDEDVDDFTYYTAFEYTDITLLADGTCSVNLDECTLTDNTFYSTGSWLSHYYNGYQKLDSLFSDYVTSYIDNYNYESTVTE